MSGKSGVIRSVLSFLLISGQLEAEQPGFNIQGHLVDQSGKNRSGQVLIAFSVFPTPTGGVSPLYFKSMPVNLRAGEFQVALPDAGDNNARLSDVLPEESWLEIKIQNEPPMARQRLQNMPYAIKANKASQADNAAKASRLAPNAVTEGDLQILGSVKVGALSVIDNTGKWIGDPTGLQGAQGAQGIPGTAGAQGPQGIPGIKGDKGDRGDAGIQGIQGIPGERGVKGDRGDPGPIGMTGTAGSPGATGPQGEPGASPFTLSGNDAVYNQGNVGIGTNSPAAMVHLFKAGPNRLRIESSEGSAQGVSFISSFRHWDLLNNGGGDFVLRNATNGNANPFSVSGSAPDSSLIIDSQGRVGIGTTAPTQKLDTAGFVKGRSGLCIGDDCRTSWPGGGVSSELDTLESVTSRGGITANLITVGGMNVLAPANKPAIALLGSSSNQMAFFGIGGISNDLLIERGNDVPMGAGSIRFMNQGEKMRIDSSGNVGIGTISPGNKLSVNGTGGFLGHLSVGSEETGMGGESREIDLVNTQPGSAVGLFMMGHKTEANSHIAGIGVANQVKSRTVASIGMGTGSTLDSGYISFNVSGVNQNPTLGQRMIITETGHVGIGTANPPAHLSVAGGGVFSGEVDVLSKLRIGAPPALQLGAVLHVHAADNTSIRLTNNFVQAPFAFQFDLNGTNANIVNTANGTMSFGTNNQGVMVLDTNARVGIGVGSPQAKLDVNGEIRGVTKNFKIEHPLDSTKLLAHGTVESPEYGLIYRGTAKLVNGVVVITLPDYFEALAALQDRTLQITCKNGWSPLYRDGEITNGQFTVKTTAQGNQDQEFDWMLQTKRADSYVRKHPFELVQDKPVEKIKQSEWDRLSLEQQEEKKMFARIEVVPN